MRTLLLLGLILGVAAPALAQTALAQTAPTPPAPPPPSSPAPPSGGMSVPAPMPRGCQPQPPAPTS